jgi:hypothetical protein
VACCAKKQSRQCGAAFRGPGKGCDSNKNGVGQVIGFEQISDLPMSGLKEVTMAKKKKAKSATRYFPLK